MPRLVKRKTDEKNDARLYQAGVTLSTQVVSRAGLPGFLQKLLTAQPPHVWLLSGSLGAGKTTLVQELGRLLDVQGDITSPTFSLQKIHPLKNQPWDRLVHLDAYRLQSLHEVAALELEEHTQNPQNLVLVEWPERLADFPWGPRLLLTLRPIGNEQRRQIRVQLF